MNVIYINIFGIIQQIKHIFSGNTQLTVWSVQSRMVYGHISLVCPVRKLHIAIEDMLYLLIIIRVKQRSTSNNLIIT